MSLVSLHFEESLEPSQADNEELLTKKKEILQRSWHQ